MKYQVGSTSQYRKDIKRFRNHRKVLNAIEDVVELLEKDLPLAEKYRDHELKGSMGGLRECHVRPDVLLCYTKDKNILVLTLVRVGSHAMLFGK